MLCGHAQTGKTSLAELILYKCGAVSRLGKVDEGTTTSDYEDDEKERKSSVNLSGLFAEYKGNFLQFIDTPGYLDFIGEIISAARAVDFAVIVIDAAAGVEVGTEKAWDIVQRENLPCIFFINKFDKENTNFTKVFDEIKSNLTKNATAVTVFEKGKIADVFKDKNSAYYGQIAEKVAESNDTLLEKYLESGTVDEKEFGPAFKKAVAGGQLFPVLCGVVTQELGIEPFLELILDMPSPFEAAARKMQKNGQEVLIEPNADAPLVAQVFKTIIDPFVGQLNFFRVFSGKITSNSEVFNVTKQNKEKFGQIYFPQGKQQVQQETVAAGEIAAVAKLKDVSTGDIFADSNVKIEFPVMEFPVTVFSASVKPKTRHDEEKISSALHRITSEDPTFKVMRDKDTAELIISGMGELHLRIIIDRMRKKYGVDVELATPRVAYKETITRALRGDRAIRVKYKKQTGGHGQYGDCMIEVEPLERGKGFEFVDKIVGGAIPRNFIPSVEKGIVKSMGEGFLAGFPVVDLRVNLVDGSYHDVDSSDIAFQIAASMAFKKAVEDASPALLEPIMNVEIGVPGEFMGQVTGSINSHRGRIMGMDAKGKNETVKAQIPLSEMFKYASDLRSITAGRGSYTMSLAHYDVLTGRLAQAVIDQSKKEKEKELVAK